MQLHDLASNNPIEFVSTSLSLLDASPPMSVSSIFKLYTLINGVLNKIMEHGPKCTSLLPILFKLCESGASQTWSENRKSSSKAFADLVAKFYDLKQLSDLASR